MEQLDLLGTSDSTWMGEALNVPAADCDEQAITEFICPVASNPSDEATCQPNKRRNSSPDVVKKTIARDGKRIKSLDKGDVSYPIILYDGHQLQHLNQETQSLLFSCHPRGASSGKILDPSGNMYDVPHISSIFKLDRTKHKIFLSHSGAQKGFVEQLCVDLEARGYFFPFLDQRHHSLPKGKDFVPLIEEAARLCHVAVMVLSNEFLCSKWPMIELVEFHAAQQAGNHQLNMLPLFYKLSVDDLDEKTIENRWMPIWIQHASKDKRIDVTKWSAAVTALRRANGLIFHKNAMSKVAYRKDVVQLISRLSPPDLLNDSSRDMVGYDRMCQIVSSQFVQDITVGAPVLGLHGTSGLGKSTLCKALCDYFSGKFLGRVCHVELGETFRMAKVSHSGLDEASKMKRQHLMLQKLCSFDKGLLSRITDTGQGLKQMREFMKREPVFLAIDNVTNDESSRKEAHAYLTVGFHAESRIIITSRSEVVVQDLLPGVKFCMPMPSLSVNEAGSIFLRSAAPMKSIFMLTDEERRIVGLCIEQCLFESDRDESGSSSDQDELRFLTTDHQLSLRRNSYHPLALSALGDFFYRFIGSTHILHWKDHLERNEHPLKDVWRCPSIMSVISLQFNILHPSEQLLFLDIALFTEDLVMWHQLTYQSWIEWLSRLHEETPTVMERKLRDLKRSGMIDWCEETEEDEGFYVYVHALYKEFAEWYVTEHDVRGLKNAWGVFQASGSSLGCDPPVSKYWSDLVRIRIFDSTRASSRFVTSKTMLELHNLVLLQIYMCTDLTVLNLEGLDNLRHLELVKLSELVAVTFGGSLSTNENVGIFDSLQNVLLTDLEALTSVPDLRACTALYSFYLSNCPQVTNFEAIECPQIKELVLIWLVPHQFGRLPNFKSLDSLVFVHIGAHSDIDMFVAEWEKPLRAMDAQLPHKDPLVHFGMPSFMLLEELVRHIRQCNHLRFKEAHHYLQPWMECCSTDKQYYLEQLKW
ncbi:hypothetical protein KC19_4G242500 [Ceratodon purpureus]|uniref:TIR domain-containing protein n=1 Tax=Ceratodon purpureus TaxID=3225 RepID=A0A8T0IEG9_CERPU|nr:hypothetical protein KC19_4G242500 [Ceratodon purpureus]